MKTTHTKKYTYVAIGILALNVLQACSSTAPVSKTPSARDPNVWTTDGYLRASPKNEQEHWARIEEVLAKAGSAPIPASDLIWYLRYSPDGAHAEQVRALLNTRLAAPADEAVLVAPDAACRAKIEQRYRSVFKLEQNVPFPGDVFTRHSTMVFPSRSGAPAAVEKRLISDMVYNPVSESCTVMDRYEGVGFSLPECNCRALDPTAATRPRGKQASVLDEMGGLKAMRDACAKNGVDVGSSIGEYRKVIKARAEGETAHEARRRAAGKPLSVDETYDARIWARVLADLGRDAHNPATYQSQAEQLKTLTPKDAPEACQGVRAMAADFLMRELWSMKMRESVVKETWFQSTQP